MKLVLSDSRAQRDRELNRRLEALERPRFGGSPYHTISADVTPNRVAPKAPGNLVVTTAFLVGLEGTAIGRAEVTWDAVTFNVDETPIDDLDGYLISYLIPSQMSTWSGESFTRELGARIDSLRPGDTIEVRVRARDLYNNLSDYTTSAVVSIVADATPPNTPSTPIVDSSAFLGALRITWNGLDENGNQMPAKFDRVEVHASTVDGFTATFSTMRTDITARGGVVTVPLTVGVVWYVTLVAFDRSGNRSIPSVQVSGTPRAAVSGDLGASIIQEVNMAPDSVASVAIKSAAVIRAKIANAAIGNAQIDVLAVNDANIASCSIGKLIAGTLTADLVVGARIKTADTGARVELNSAGLKVYNSSNAVVVDLNSNGTATFTGTVTASNIYTKTTHPRLQLGPAVQYLDTEPAITYTDTSDSLIRGLIASGKYANGAGHLDLWAFHTATQNGALHPYSYLIIGGAENTGDTGFSLSTDHNATGRRPAGRVQSSGDLYLYADKDNADPNRHIYTFGGIAGEGAGGTARSVIRQWERHRINQNWPNAAFHDVTVTWEVNWSGRPIVLPCVSFSGALGANASVTTFNSGTTACSFRIHDVNNANRSGVNYDIDIWACR